MPPWIAADYLLGFFLGLALGVMCIDTGFRQAKSPAQYVTPTTRSLTNAP